MVKLRVWLNGKKTYLLAGAILAATAVLVATGKLTPTTALTLLLVAAGGFPATFRAALQSHHNEELTLLTHIALTGVDIASRNMPAALKDGSAAATDGLHLVQELQPEGKGPVQG
jgi:hypothetical protein